MHVGQAVRIFRQPVQNVAKQHTRTSCHRLFATGITAPRLVHLGFCTAVAVICAEPQWTQGEWREVGCRLLMLRRGLVQSM
eukprot:4662377-Alexandrium_andersonii.AAC.1